MSQLMTIKSSGLERCLSVMCGSKIIAASSSRVGKGVAQLLLAYLVRTMTSQPNIETRSRSIFQFLLIFELFFDAKRDFVDFVVSERAFFKLQKIRQ